MKRLPEVGARVRFNSATFPDRTVTGTVRKIYPGYRGESLIPVPIGKGDWAERWSAAVEVDERPIWWGYSENRFAPSIAELEPLGTS